MDKEGQRLRSQFFSSVAHELRTPLNSIIPILALVLRAFSSPTLNPEQIARVSKMIKIAHNSALHLESVIEDALDVSRLENDKFSLNLESFDFREMEREVEDIMQF